MPLWQRVVERGRVRYEINPQHPLVTRIEGAKGEKGDAGVAGPAGPAGAEAPQSAALGGGAVATKAVTIRTSCVIRRNKAKRRVAKCVVKVPAGTPKATWALTSGGHRIASGKLKAGQRTLVINAVIPKAINGWVSVKVTKS